MSTDPRLNRKPLIFQACSATNQKVGCSNHSGRTMQLPFLHWIAAVAAPSPLALIWLVCPPCAVRVLSMGIPKSGVNVAFCSCRGARQHRPAPTDPCREPSASGTCAAECRAGGARRSISWARHLCAWRFSALLALPSHAPRCCRFRLPGSMWPLRVAAANTHSGCEVPRASPE